MCSSRECEEVTVLPFGFVMKVILTSSDHLCLKLLCSDSQVCLRGDQRSGGGCSSSEHINFKAFWRLYILRLKNEELFTLIALADVCSLTKSMVPR